MCRDVIPKSITSTRNAVTVHAGPYLAIRVIGEVGLTISPGGTARGAAMFFYHSQYNACLCSHHNEYIIKLRKE